MTRPFSAIPLFLCPNWAPPAAAANVVVDWVAIDTQTILCSAMILAIRSGDGSFPSNPEVFSGGTGPGQRRPTLPAFASMAVSIHRLSLLLRYG